MAFTLDLCNIINIFGDFFPQKKLQLKCSTIIQFVGGKFVSAFMLEKSSQMFVSILKLKNYLIFLAYFPGLPVDPVTASDSPQTPTFSCPQFTPPTQPHSRPPSSWGDWYLEVGVGALLLAPEGEGLEECDVICLFRLISSLSITKFVKKIKN